MTDKARALLDTLLYSSFHENSISAILAFAEDVRREEREKIANEVSELYAFGHDPSDFAYRIRALIPTQRTEPPNPVTSPTHTDLMVAPETLARFMEDNPLPEDGFKQYRRSQMAELRPYVPGEKLDQRVSISAADLEAGSPKPGDMIARNPANHRDLWLVAADYFAANFETAPPETPIPRDLAVAQLIDSATAFLTRVDEHDWFPTPEEAAFRTALKLAKA